MTAADLHLASPTVPERALLKLADALTVRIERRREQRAERREMACGLASDLRERRDRGQDATALDIALLALGSRPRR